MNIRHKARETALQILYTQDIAEAGPAADFGAQMEELQPGTEARRYCEFLVRGIISRKLDIDSEIEENSENWTLERMAVVDRNILRLAVFELLYSTDTPFKVVIDEAVELAKKYGSEESGAFINGVIDKIHRNMNKGIHAAR